MINGPTVSGGVLGDKYDFVDKTVLFRGGANVTYWHLADISRRARNVCCWG
jgi:hypothetical protein